MNRKLLIWVVLLLLCVSSVFAESGELEFALFKRTVSPVMKWGENGVLTVPKATTVGRTNTYIGLFGQQAGTINDMDLYLTSLTAMAGSSEDVELGYTRRQLIWEDLFFTDMAMDTFHLKARILDFNQDLIPEVAVGMNGVSLVDNSFSNTKDILFNPYLVATSNLKIIPDFFEISITALAETIMSEGEFGKPQFSIGADAQLLNFLYVFGELQGLQVDLENIDLSKTTNEMVNVGARLKLGWVSIGAGMFNIIRETETDSEDSSISSNISESTFNLDNARYMASVIVEIPLGQITGSKEN
ncbi:MAG: hypothetical protein ACQEQU_07615 [Spirochaetota bacterium]